MKPLLILVLAFLVAFALGGCGSDSDSSGGDIANGTPGDPPSNEIGPVHVHGLGVNPADDALFVATHTGLYRVADGENELERVGDNYQDTMGFTVIGPDRFLGSGHPDARMHLPPYLGLIESDDAGEKWESISLLGEADFHVLEAFGERVYGFGSDFESRREQFLVSDDGGQKWESREVPESLLSLAIDPEEPDTIVASGRHSLFRSDNGGQSWQSLPGEPGLLSWPEAGSLYVADKNGTVAVSDEADSEWSPVGELGEPPASFEAASAEEIYAAMHDGSVVGSDDGGQTWVLRARP